MSADPSLPSDAAAAPRSDMAHPLPCVCLCVDDFGLHAAINDAVLHLLELGRIGATGAMVDGPAWTAGAAALHAQPAGHLDVGLHLDLTEAALASESRAKLPLRQLIVASYTRRLDPSWLASEVRRQLDAFERAWQQPPAFVDGHQHVHQLPMVREALLDELLQRYPDPAQRPWLRDTRPALGLSAGVANAFKAAVIAALGRPALRRMATTYGFATNRALSGVYDFQGDGVRYQQLLGAWLLHARHGDVLMCHPATAMVQGDAIAAARCNEYQVLASEWFGGLLEQLPLRIGPLARWLREAQQARHGGTA